MISMRFLLSDTGIAPFNDMFVDTLPSVPREGEIVVFNIEEYIVRKVSYNVPDKVITIIAIRKEI